MSETAAIPLAKLLLDTSNARLGEEQDSQAAAAVALANQQGRRIVSLAEDVVAHGLDPTNLPAVIPTDDTQRRYKVIEGNRRVLALKSLDTPTLISSVLTPTDQRRLSELAKSYAENPIEDVTCILFDSEDEVFHWVELRHTGANNGAGLVERDTNEQDRFRARHGHGKPRKPAGQIIDFMKEVGGVDASGDRISTTLQRIINTPDIRDALGIQVQDGQVISHYPTSEVLKGLRRIVDDLRTKNIKVKDVYEAKDRMQYIHGFAADELPDKSKALDQPMPLSNLATGEGNSYKPKSLFQNLILVRRVGV